MFELNYHTGKRVMAMLLVLAMMFAMLGDYAPTWFAAVAEEVTEEASGHSESSDSESGSSGEHESSHEDSGSSEEHGDSGSSEEHEDSGSSGKHEDSGSSETLESAPPEETVVWGDASGDGSAGSEDEHDDEAAGDGEAPSDYDPSDDIEPALPEVAVIWGEASVDEHASSENEHNDAAAGDGEASSPEEIIIWGAAPGEESGDSEDEHADAAVEHGEDTSEDEGVSGASTVSEIDEDSAVDDTIPVVIWGSFEDADTADETETGTAPSEEPAPAEAKGEPIGSGAEDSVPSGENTAPEAAVEEIEVLIGETAPSDTGAGHSGDGAPTEETVPVETKTEQIEAGDVLTLTAEKRAGASDGEAAFTTQAYVAPVVLSDALEAEGGENKTCVLQQKIDDALAAVRGQLTGKVKVVLEKGTAYDGEVSVEKGDREVAEDFELEIETEDAGDDGQQADGETTFTGTMTIKGINIAIRGVGLPGKVAVEGAKLTYTGTKADDTVNVAVSGGATASIQTGAGDDTINATAEAPHATEEITLSVDSGEGDDSVSAKLSDSASAGIRTGAGKDTVKLTDASRSKDVSVSTGDGSDTVDVDIRQGSAKIDTGDGDDEVALRNGGAQAMTPSGTVEVTLGNGGDAVTVDMSVSNAVKRVLVHGGEGGDRVHLTGTLKSGDDAASGTEDNLTLQGENNALNIVSDGVETVTDDLANKRTVKLTPAGDGSVSYVARDAFTNYIINAPASRLNNIVITTADGKKLALSGVVIDIETDVDGENKLLIGENTTVDVRGLKLMLKGRNIEVNGTIRADAVQIEALDGTGMYTRSFSDMYKAYDESISVDYVGDAAAAVAAGAEMALDLINVSDQATIVIGEKAAVYASGDVMLLARVEQTGGLISLLPTVNLVDVKVARASVDIAGKVFAGYDFEKNRVGNGTGSVKADARIKTTMGYDSDGAMIDGLPLAISVATLDAQVNVKRGAAVRAAQDIALGSKSELKVSTHSDSGLGGLPVAVAVSVLMNDVHTTVDGSLTAGRNIRVNAEGRTESGTEADKGKGHESLSGGFAAVSVALQDVEAKIASHANLKAGKDVGVNSSAVEKVTNTAASGAQDGEGETNRTAAKVLNFLKEKAWPFIKKKISSPTAQEKLDAAMKKVATSSSAVKLDDDAKKKGDVSLTTDESGDKATAKVEVSPWPGYKVKSITWRGYNPGEGTYAVGTVKNGKAFTLTRQNVTIFVEYEEDENYEEDLSDTAADLFGDKQQDKEEIDIQQLLDDATSGTDDTGRELDEALREVEENTKFVDLKLEGSGGAVLTWETDPDKPTESLKKIDLGGELRLVPNPEEGKTLRKGGLKVVYKVEEGDRLVAKKEIVNPDAQGRYIFKVPEELDEDSGLTVTAEFIDNGSKDVEADDTQTQVTGVVSVAVVNNDNQALIDAGAAITAGGSVTVKATDKTDVSNVSDGTAASKEESEKKAKDDDAIKRPKARQYSGYDARGLTYGLLLDGTQNGAVTFEKDDDRRFYTYTFTPEPVEGYSVAGATVTFYEDGKLKTEALKARKGKYAIDLEALSMDKGSTAVVNFAFAKEGVYGETVSTQAAQAVIANPIRFSYNALKDDEEDEVGDKVGQIKYDSAREDGDGRVTAYLFEAEADGDAGYGLDGKLKAEWTDAAGTKHEVELEEGEDDDKGKWVLELDQVPEGAPITVSCVFKEDFHDFKVDEKETKNGAVTLHDDKLKTSDEPKITVKPDAGYAIDDVIVTFRQHGLKKTIKLSDKESKLEPVKDKDGNEREGVYTFEVPGLSEGDITVSATFKQKTIGVYAGKDDKDEDYVLSEKNVAAGDVVKVTPSEDKIKAGYRIEKVTVTDKSSDTVAESSDGSFTVPSDTGKNEKLTVTVKLVEKEIALSGSKLENGEVEPVNARADRGEKVTVKVSPEDDFKVKSGTLRAVIEAEDGSYTEEVYMARQDDETYTFIMPPDIADPTKVKVSFKGEFEPGQSDTSAVDTSLGAGVSVTVSNSDNRAVVAGAVNAGGSLRAVADIEGGVSTESSAGYSKGNIGVGGAVSVQVASMDSRAMIRDGATVALGGDLNIEANSEIDFGAKADASGSEEAEKVGVGAGIAVAVNGSQAFAGVQDGAKLTANDAGELSITATQKAKDTVSAKAGAAGGTAAVPVAAVDVTAVSADAYLGRVSGNMLDFSDNAALSAIGEVAHAITADASAAGKGAGIGAAIGVSVIDDAARARLNQSLNAAQLTVTSELTSTVNENISASASGGEAEGKSPDEQADGLMGGAAKIAGNNRSGGVSAGKIDQASKDRQKSETSEGTVGVAGAVAVNVQSSESRAEIMNGVNVHTEGLTAVTAQNGTRAEIRANASTTNSDIGVGVGVAINIVNLTNIANMGDGEIEAAMLRVAATTKETTPDEEPEVGKVENKDELAEQLGEAVRGYVEDLLREMGVDKYISAETLGGIVEAVVSETAGELIEATGLKELLGDGNLRDKYEKAVELLKDGKDGLFGLPEKLIEPFMDAYGDVVDLSDLSSEDWTKIKNDLVKEFTTQLEKNYADVGTGILDRVKDGMIEYVKDDISSILNGVLGGKFKKVFKDAFKEAKKQIGKAVKAELKNFAVELFRDTLLNVQIPGVTEDNAEAVVSAFKAGKDAWKNESLEGIFETAGDYVLDTFKEEVFDYEAMLTTLADEDFKDNIMDGIRSAAKKAAVTLTNEAIGALTAHFDLTLEAGEQKAEGHVIDTQAIAGAGAREVGVAGSVAITVLNAETKAIVADGAKLEVSGDMAVEANELRAVHNTASAAVDARGNASANKGAVADADKDVADGSAGSTVKSGHVTLALGAGAEGTILQGDKADDKPRIYIELKDGWEFKEKDGKILAEYSYTKKDGFEVSGTVEVKKEGDRYVLDPASGELSRDKVDADVDVALTLDPVEALRELPAPELLTDGKVNVPEGTVTVAVRDREVENGKLSARAGDMMEIRVAKGEGRKVGEIGYSYEDAEGNRHDVVINPSEDNAAGKEKAYTQRTSNEDEYVYAIEVPVGTITDIVVSFEEGAEPDAGDSKTSAVDGTGKGVGVGAAFSMVYGDSSVKAEIGARSVSTGALNVTAVSEHSEDIASVAGSDPLADETDEDDIKKYSVDASVSLNILDNDIAAAVSRDARVKTTGDLNVSAKEESVTGTTSSAFAVGGRTAVGASAAVNIASSDVKADLSGGATVGGSVGVTADSHSEDTTNAIATAMGADIARSLNKVHGKVDDLEEGANGLLDGSYLDKKDDKDDEATDTNKNITEKLNNKKSDDGKTAKENTSVSQNVLRSQGVKAEGENAGNEGAEEAENQIGLNTDSKVDAKKDGEGSTYQVAAAVGVTVTAHNASVNVGSITAAKDIIVTAENTANFNTQGTGAAMSLAEHANSIAAGIAVSVSENAAAVEVSGELVSNEKGDVNAASKLTQNLDGDFAGKLAAQALSGSVAGKDSKLSIAGAVSVVVSKAKSTVNLAGGSEKTRLHGGDIAVEATDKSRLTARAGGLSLSRGASIGMGIASTAIVSQNDVRAEIGQNHDIRGGSLKLNAEKLAVTAEDFKNLIDMRYLVTDSSKLSDEEREKADLGLIDLHKGEDDDSYSMDINLSSDKLLKAMDGLNFLSGQNTYAEAIAGSVAFGGTNAKLSLAGSFAVATAKNNVFAGMGEGTSVRLTADGGKTGDMTVNSAIGTTSRIIAGSLSAAPAKTSVGATVAVLLNSDTAKAHTGANSAVDAAGDVTQTAETTGDAQVFTAAMAVAAAVDKSTNAAGGAVNVIINKSVTENNVGSSTSVKAGGAATIDADTEFDLMVISGSANVAASATSSVAAGGTVNVIVDRAESSVSTGRGVDLDAQKGVKVASDVSDQLISGAASLSAAASIDGKAGAGAVNVIVSRSAAETKLGDGNILNAQSGDVRIAANNDAWMLNATLAAAGGGNKAIGGSFNVNVFDRKATLNVGRDSRLTAGGDLLAQAGGRDSSILAGLALAGAGTGMALSGNAVVLVQNNEIKTTLGENTAARAAKNAVLESYYSDFTVAAAGSVAVSGFSSAVGATVATVVKNNDIGTYLNNASVTAESAGETVETLSGAKGKGVYVGANAAETQFVGGAGVAVAGGSAINGVVAVLVNNNRVISDASRAVLSTDPTKTFEWKYDRLRVTYNPVGDSYKYTNWFSMSRLEEYLEKLKAGELRYLRYTLDGKTYTLTKNSDLELKNLKNYHEGSISVKAEDDTKQLLLAGGLSASLGSGAGAAVVTLVSNKDVEAKAHDMNAHKKIAVSANNRDDITQLAISAGLAGGSGVQIGAAVQVLKSKAIANVDGRVTSLNGDFDLKANNDTTLYNVGAALLAAVGGAAVTPVGVVTYFQGQTEAKLTSDASVEANNINIRTTADKKINMYAAGMAVSSGVGVSGTVSVLVSKDTNKASAMAGAALTARNELNVGAKSDYRLRAASAALSAAGTVAVGVNAVVSVLKSNTIAELGGVSGKEVRTSDVKAKRLSVRASGKRDVIDIGASAAVAGTVGAGVTLMVLSAGAAMSQDAADLLAYGNGDQSKKNGKTGFDASKFMDTVEANGIASDHYGDSLDADTLEEDLKGNGHRESQQQIGSRDYDGTTFDASSKYRSKDLDDKNFGVKSEEDKKGKDDKDSEDGAAKGRGEDLSVTSTDKDGREVDTGDTTDVKNARNVNTYTYYDPTDAVIARITDRVSAEAEKVNVEATQPVTVDLLGAALGGGTVGVGVSTAVAILHSNVSASSMGELKNVTEGVTVRASSASGKFDEDVNADERDDAAADILSNKPEEKDTENAPGDQDKASLEDKLRDKVRNRSIRVMGVAVGVGYVGLAVSAAVALTDNTTEAVLGGKVTGAGAVDVAAKHDYGSVMAATGAVAGGVVGAAASVAVAQANGKVKSVIERNAVVRAEKDINVKTDTNVGVDSLAVTAGVGFVAVNAGVGLSFNRLEQETGIDAGADIETDGDVNLKAVTETAANSYLLGVSVGGVGVSMNAAVSNVAAKVNTHLGESLPSRAGDPDSRSMPEAKVKAKNVSVINDVRKSLSEPQVLSVAAGGVAVGGNALLAFNDAEVLAMVDNGNVKAENLDVVSNLKGDTRSSLTAAQVGGIAVGVSVNYADMKAYNTAIIRNSSVRTTGETHVETNRNGAATTAEAHTVSANAGLITVGMNAAIARNNSRSYATIIGDGTRIMDFNKLTMHARGNSSAVADMEGVDFGAISVAASIVVALNDADARTTVLTTDLEEGEYTDDGNVKLKTNLKAAKGLTFDVTQLGDTRAKVSTGGGSLIGAALNVAMAYGRTKSVVDAAIHGGGEYASINSTNTARNHTVSEIGNSAFSLLSAAARYGAAYSQDLYYTNIQLTGGDFTVNGDVDVRTDYDITTTADVTPSTGGLDISLGSLSVNEAMARNTAYAEARFEKSIGTGTIRGDLKVRTRGSAIADAKVNTAAISASVVSAGANIATADLSMQQAASLVVGGNLDVDGSLDVQSVIKKAPAGGDRLARATASVASVASNSDSFNISLGEFNVSKAVARENMQNTSAIRGGASGVKKIMARVDKGYYDMVSTYDYDYDQVDTITYRLKVPGDHFTLTSGENEYAVKRHFLMDYLFGWEGADENTFSNKRNEYEKVQAEYLASDKDIRRLHETLKKYTEDEIRKMSDFGVSKIIHGMRKNNLQAIRDLEGTTDLKTVLVKLSDYTDANLFTVALQSAVYEADKYGLLEWEETYNYKKTNQTRTEWVEKWETMLVEVPEYNAQDNRIKAGSANIYAAGGTRSEARTDGAMSFSGITAGSLSADSASTDNVTAIVEGVRLSSGKDITIRSEGDTTSSSVGYKPGSISLVDAGNTDVKARVGTLTGRQSVSVVVGDEVQLSADGRIDMSADNQGSTVARMEQGKSGSFGKIKTSTQTTESYYNTLISFGTGTILEGDGGVSIKSNDAPMVQSKVASDNVGIVMNFNTMMGKNQIRQENNIDFGSNASIASRHGKVFIEARQSTKAEAETANVGGSFLEGSNAQAYNLVDRQVRVNLRDTYITADEKTLTARAISGEGDKIKTRAYTGSKGLASAAKATAKTDVRSDAEIIIGIGASMTSGTGTTLEAIATSYRDKGTDIQTIDKGNGKKEVLVGNQAGIETIGQVDSKGAVSVPNGVAKNDLTFNAFIQINDHGTYSTRTYVDIMADRGPVNILASNDGLTASTDALVDGKGGVGISSATAWNVANLENAIVIDDAYISSGTRYATENLGINIYATNGTDGPDRTHLTSTSHATLMGVAGKVAPTSRITGTQVNQIRTSNEEKVSFNVTKGEVVHTATAPEKTLRAELTATYDRNEIELPLVTVSLTVADVIKTLEWYVHARCDFCHEGQEVDVKPSSQETVEERYKQAYEAALANIDTIEAMARKLRVDPQALIGSMLARGLLPLTYLNTLVSRPSVVYMARYGVEDRTAIDRLYVLDIESILKNDARLDGDAVRRGFIWTNTATEHDIYLLPNAARMILNGSGMPQYVSDVFTSMNETGKAADIEIIVALSRYALDRPVLPIGSDGALDFASGDFTIPQQAEMELYLDEISARWLVDNMTNGTIRTLVADIDAINSFMYADGDLPSDTIVETLTDGGIHDGLKLYWIGETPETAASDDTDLLLLAVDEAADELWTYRTTRAMIENGAAPVPVNLYLYRDSKSDQREEEKYNVIFFDTPAGQSSMMKVLTDVVKGHTIEMPRSMRVILRPRSVEGSPWPAYTVSRRLLALADGTRGTVSMFDGFYLATFDGDTFESDYTRIEGIASGDLRVILKKDQPVWPEWTGETTAEDLNGDRYVLSDGQWTQVTEQAAA